MDKVNPKGIRRTQELLPHPQMYASGGSVQACGGVYIKRQLVDDALFQYCLQGEYVNISAPRQCGKSSLIIETIQRLHAHKNHSDTFEVGCAYVDCSEYIQDSHDINSHEPDSIFLHLIAAICDELSPEFNYQEWWKENCSVEKDDLSLFFLFIRKVLVTDLYNDKRVILFFDEIDSWLETKFHDRFFTSLRALFQRRSRFPELMRFSVVIIGVADINDLITPKHTPYNIGVSLSLPDFTLTEVEPFAVGLGLPAADAKEVITRVHGWTNGQPYLTNLVCRTISSKVGRFYQHGAEIPGLELVRTPEQVDEIVRELFFNCVPEQGDVNLRTINKVLTDIARQKGVAETLLDTYFTVLDASLFSHKHEEPKPIPPIYHPERPAHALLRLSGVVGVDDRAYLVSRNLVYSHVFNKLWIDDQRAILREITDKEENIEALKVITESYKEEKERNEGTAQVKDGFNALWISATVAGFVFVTTHNTINSVWTAFIVCLVTYLFGPVSRKVNSRYNERVVGLFKYYDVRNSDVRKQYLEYLWFRYRDLDLKGLSTQAPISLALENVFVDLTLTPCAPGQAQTNPLGTAIPSTVALPNELPDVLRTGRHSLIDFLAVEPQQEIRHLTLLGPPGSGKTTLLKHVILMLCSPRGQTTRPPKWLEGKIPILLFLRDHITSICPSSRQHRLDRITVDRSFGLVQAAREALKGRMATMPSEEWFNFQLSEGNCIVLLDGLDEVADSEAHRLVVEWVEIQKAAYGKNAFVVTSRPVGYQEYPISGCHVLEIVPFSQTQQERFIRNWYLEEEIKSRPGQIVDAGTRMLADEGADDLLRRIHNNRILTQLAVNPLLLVMITTIHRYRSSLPARRVDFYSEVCEVFLGKRRAATGITDDFTPAQKQSILQVLAFTMMQEKVRQVSDSDAANIIADHLYRVKPDVRPEDFLKLVEGTSGLIIETEGSHYSFAHLTFQEFLAATHVRGKPRHVAIFDRSSWRYLVA